MSGGGADQDAGAGAGEGRRPTHKDIARLARTSQATVSLVLNNRDGLLRISARTREAVLTAARQLGYLPDLSARRLRHRLQGRSGPEMVLAVLRPAGTPLGVAVHVIDAAQASLTALAGAPGATQLVLEEYQPGHLGEHPGLLAGARFHGGIVTGPTPEDEAFLEDNDLQVPVVAFQRRLRRHAYVDVDNVTGGAAATRHLLARGRRRVAAVSYAFPPSRAQQARLEGYRQALAEAGLGESAEIVLAPVMDAAGAAAAGARLLDEWRPDAVFALGDLLAIGVIHAVRRRGQRVPQDVAVVGYDDVAQAEFLDPPLTSVRLPYGEMAAAAVAWLATAVRGRGGEPLQRVFQPRLVVRESS